MSAIKDYKLEEIFIKECDSQSDAKAEYERTLDIYEKIAECKPSRLRIVKPIAVENSVIYFQKAPVSVNLRDLICKYYVKPKILYYVGQALGQFHSILNPEKNILQEKIHIHGDFWPSNVIYDEENELVYIVDFAPSDFNKSRPYCIDSAYVDISHMLFSLKIKYPLYKAYLLIRKANQKLAEQFLKGYEDETGGEIDYDTLSEYIIHNINSANLFFEERKHITRALWKVLFNIAKKKYETTGNHYEKTS